MHNKQNNKESKTHVQGLRMFGNTLPRNIKGMLKRHGYNYAEIVSKWTKLVGASISSSSYPLSIKINKNKSSAALLLAVKRGNELTVEYSKKEIINKINSYFGYQLINEIRLRAINSEIKKNKKRINLNKFIKNYDEKINQIKNEKIRNSLSELIGEIKK